MGTSDFFTALIQSHEKMAWMLRATVNDIGNED
jgi:DNA-binding ferritin-like protein